MSIYMWLEATAVQISALAQPKRGWIREVVTNLQKRRGNVAQPVLLASGTEPKWLQELRI